MHHDFRKRLPSATNASLYARSGLTQLVVCVARLSAEVEGEGWKAVLPNALATAREGNEVSVTVAVGAEAGAEKQGKVWLTATSENDEKVSVKKVCKVRKI